MSSGWSWDPASVLGTLNANRLPLIQNVADGPRPTGFVPLSHVVGCNNENVAPLQVQVKPTVPSPPAAAAAAAAPSPATPVNSARSTASKKRKSEVQEPPEDLPEISDDDHRLDFEHIDQTCGQMRQKIRRFLASGEMKVGEFQDAIDVGSVAYYRFMNQNGPEAGNGSSVFCNAWKFFKKRELQGVQNRPPKRAKSTGTTSTPKAKASGAKGKAAASSSLDVGDEKLHREEDGKVPVFDTCDDIRKKIRALLRKDDVTQAAFVRAISQSFPGERKLSSKQLSDFLAKRGPVAGNTSGVYYGSYVFFEKLRIKDGKPKTEKRVQMERVWKGKGVDTETNLNGGVFCREGEVVTMDDYGKIHIH